MDIKRLNPLIRERVISNGKVEVKNKIQKPDTERANSLLGRLTTILPPSYKRCLL